MKSIFLKASVISILSITSVGITYADQISYKRPTQDYTVTITSTNARQAVPIEGSIMAYDDNGSHLTLIQNVTTPVTVKVKGSFVGLSVKGSEDYPNIKVEMEMQTDDNAEPIKLVGKGHAVFGSEDSYTQYITTSK